MKVFEQINFKLVIPCQLQKNSFGSKPSYHDDSQFTLRQICQLHLLDCNRLTRAPVQSPVYRAKRSLSQAISQLLENYR